MPSIGFGLEKLGLPGLKRPWFILFLVLFGSAVAIAGLPHIKFRGNITDIFKSSSEYYLNFKAFSKRFPTSEKEILISLEKKDFLSRESVKILNEGIMELAFVDGVKGITSILSINQVPDAEGETAPLIPAEALPKDEKKYKTLVDKVKNHPLIKGSMFAEDVDGTGLTLLVMTLTQETLDKKETYAVIDKVKEQLKVQFGSKGYKTGIAGESAIQKEIYESILSDRIVFNVGGFLIGSLLCTFFFRRLDLIIITSSGPLVAVLWAMGFIGWAGLNLNSFVNVIPPLLLVITFSDSLHMTFSIRRHLRAGKSKYEAAKEAVLNIGPACVLTTLTTSIAMFSLMMADSEVIRSFGFAAGIGTLMAFFAVIIVVPATTILWVRDEKSFIAEEGENEGAFAFLDYLCKLIEKPVMRYYRTIAIFGIMLACVLTWFHLQLEPNYRLSEQMPQDKGVLKVADKVDAQLGGAYSLNLMINWDKSKKYSSPEVMAVIEKVHQMLLEHPEINAISSLDKVRKWLISEGKTDIQDLIDYMEEWPSHIEDKFHNADKHTAVVTGHIVNLEARKTRKIIEELEGKLDLLRVEHPNYIFTITGLPTVSGMQSNAMITQLKWSLLTAVAIVIVLIGVAFRSFSITLLSIIPNLFPIVTVGTYLYFMDYGLQYASVMALTVSFGLAVDDTIHFMNRYQREKSAGVAIDTIVRDTLLRIGPVLILSTMILIFGLAVTILSELPVTRQFGELNIATLFAALICDLVILPAIILLAYSKGKSGEVSS